VMKDVENSLEHLSDGGLIIMHDCNPSKEKHQAVPRISKTWNGDCWKTVVRLRATRDDLQVCVLKMDGGLGIVERGKSDLLKLDKPLDDLCYADFDNNREYLTGLTTPDKWLSQSNISDIKPSH